ncbi:hypothetical protein [Streptomyces turgidiscabies]|nr:hypothetical protein [Streptomyces turgidiscabies]
MCLTAARNGGVILFTAVTDLLYFMRRYPDHDRGFEAAYAVVRRRIHSVLDAIDRPHCPRTTDWPAATPRSSWRRPIPPS